MLKVWPFKLFILFPFLLVFAGCMVPPANERTMSAQRLATDVGWAEFELTTDSFDLTGFVPSNQVKTSRQLTVYIEGDGLAWLTRTSPSLDPTPTNPLGLKLALQHPDTAVVYLARPCQLGQARNCNKRFWTSARFGSEVVNCYVQALDRLKSQFGNEKFQLIGYSGGGAIAALVAAKRGDVVRLVTVAGNLDHQTWTNLHSVTPLRESLNPAAYAESLVGIDQYHFVGADDQILPPSIANAYVGRFPQYRQPNIVIIPSFDHHCCWEEKWQDLYLNIPIQAK